MSNLLLVPVCPQCKGTGIIRQDWVQVPVWRACACLHKGNKPHRAILSTKPKVKNS